MLVAGAALCSFSLLSSVVRGGLHCRPSCLLIQSSKTTTSLHTGANNCNNNISSMMCSSQDARRQEEEPSSTTTKSSPFFRIRPSIILFGDSITQYGFGVEGSPLGWAAFLAAAYSRRADVLNRGFSGYNTDMAVNTLLPRVFTGPLPQQQQPSSSSSSPQPSLLFTTVFFGANDAALLGGNQHVPVERFGQNLEKIVNYIRSTTTTTPSTTTTSSSTASSLDSLIILLTPPPFDAQAWMNFRQISEPGRSNQVAKLYGDEVKKVANKFKNVNCIVVDTWNLLDGDKDNAKNNKHLSDGLHLNDSGNRLVYEGIVAALKEHSPRLLPTNDDGQDEKSGVAGVPLEEELWDKLLLQEKGE